MSESEPSITCPRCRMTSYHPKDIEYRYCGNCHQFHAWLFLLPPLADHPEPASPPGDETGVRRG